MVSDPCASFVFLRSNRTKDGSPRKEVDDRPRCSCSAALVHVDFREKSKELFWKQTDNRQAKPMIEIRYFASKSQNRDKGSSPLMQCGTACSGRPFVGDKGQCKKNEQTDVSRHQLWHSRLPARSDRIFFKKKSSRARSDEVELIKRESELFYENSTETEGVTTGEGRECLHCSVAEKRGSSLLNCMFFERSFNTGHDCMGRLMTPPPHPSHCGARRSFEQLLP